MMVSCASDEDSKFSQAKKTKKQSNQSSYRCEFMHGRHHRNGQEAVGVAVERRQHVLGATRRVRVSRDHKQVAFGLPHGGDTRGDFRDISEKAFLEQNQAVLVPVRVQVLRVMHVEELRGACLSHMWNTCTQVHRRTHTKKE